MCSAFVPDSRPSEIGPLNGETELDTPEVDTSSHFGNTRSRCIKQYPELGTPDLNTPELDTT